MQCSPAGPQPLRGQQDAVEVGGRQTHWTPLSVPSPQTWEIGGGGVGVNAKSINPSLPVILMTSSPFLLNKGMLGLFQFRITQTSLNQEGTVALWRSGETRRGRQYSWQQCLYLIKGSVTPKIPQWVVFPARLDRQITDTAASATERRLQEAP